MQGNLFRKLQMGAKLEEKPTWTAQAVSLGQNQAKMDGQCVKIISSNFLVKRPGRLHFGLWPIIVCHLSWLVWWAQASWWGARDQIHYTTWQPQ